MITERPEHEWLQECLKECKRRLDVYREQGNELMAALTQSDMDKMLERLGDIYRERT